MSQMSVTAYIGLGANLGDRDANLRRAIALLSQNPAIRISGVSRFQETEPLGVTDQPRFINAVLSVVTTLSAKDLLTAMLDVEQQMGRIRNQRWGPRTIDLDLLTYGELFVDEPGLKVPHPEIRNRRFVMEGLRELGATIPQ